MGLSFASVRYSRLGIEAGFGNFCESQFEIWMSNHSCCVLHRVREGLWQSVTLEGWAPPVSSQGAGVAMAEFIACGCLCAFSFACVLLGCLLATKAPQKAQCCPDRHRMHLAAFSLSGSALVLTISE